MFNILIPVLDPFYNNIHGPISLVFEKLNLCVI